VVERTFSWFGRNRRLARDFENLAKTLAALVTLASDGTFATAGSTCQAL